MTCSGSRDYGAGMISAMTGTAPHRTDPYALAQASAARLTDLSGGTFDAAVVLGSGWSAAADALGTPEREIPLAELGGFPRPSTPGHEGAVRVLQVTEGKRVLVFLGRVHMYEGHEASVVVHGVRTAIAAGARTVVLTNAAGGIRASYDVGQPVLISDHLNLTGRSPLAGPTPPGGYPGRHVDLTSAYSPRLRELARSLDPLIAEGVYAAVPGPHYETPAEIRMLRALGADLVGMSTVLETIAARHLGAEVLAVSLVTNMAAGMAAEALDHGEVIAAAAASAARVGGLLAELLPRL